MCFPMKVMALSSTEWDMGVMCASWDEVVPMVDVIPVKELKVIVMTVYWFMAR